MTTKALRPKARKKPRKPKLSERCWSGRNGEEISAYAFSAKHTCVVDPRVSEDGFYPVNPLTYYGITEEETRALDAANLKLLGYIPRVPHPEDFPLAPGQSPPSPAWMHKCLSEIGRYSYGGYTLVYDPKMRNVRITHPETKFRRTRKTFRKAERYIDMLLSKARRTK